MRSIFSFLVLLGLAWPAQALDDPEVAARLVAAGAPDLALQFARNAMQGKEPDPAWRDVYWLAAGKSGQRPDLKMPPPRERAQPTAWVAYRLALADQAAEQRNWPLARANWARAVWQEGVDAAALRRAQAGIARSWLQADQIARMPMVVNPVMLRYLQEAPRQAALAEQAALRLLDAQQAKSAANLLEAMAPQSSPLRLLAQYRLGQLTPEQAETQMRAQGQLVPLAWQGLYRLAADKDDIALKAESLEHLVGTEPAWARHAVELWQAYFVLAEVMANRQQLLTGMDAAWLAQAKMRLAKSPHEARAMLAWLAHRGGDVRLRLQALDLLADSLGTLAPRLLGDAPFALPRIAEALRYRLGKQALAAGDVGLAAGWWQGVAATATGLPAHGWYLQQAEVNVKAHHGDRAIQWLKLALGLSQSLTEAETASVLEQANALLRQGYVDAVEGIAQQLFVFAFPAKLGGVWQLRGSVAEQRGRWAEAAAHYLLAAGDAADSQALIARSHAMRDLQRAGLMDDVVRQDSLLKAAQGAGDAAP